MDQRISLITLGVNDLHASRTFYEALGWRGESPSEDIVFFQAGGMIVSLWDRSALALDSGVEDRGGWSGITLAHNVNSPADVDRVIDEARSAGATITVEPAATFWGGYAGGFRDLDGHAWEVAHNPGWTLDDDGSVHLH